MPLARDSGQPPPRDCEGTSALVRLLFLLCAGQFPVPHPVAQQAPKGALQLRHTVFLIAAAMRKDDPLGRPADHLLDTVGHRALVAKHPADAWRRLAVAVVDALDPRHGAVMRGQLGSLDGGDQVGQDQAAAGVMEEYRFMKARAALHDALFQLPRPRPLGLIGAQLAIKAEVQPRLRRALRHARRGPGPGLGPGRLPICDMREMKRVRRHQMTHLPERIKLRAQAIRQPRRRMHPEVPGLEPHHRRTGRIGKAPAADGRAVHQPYPVPPGLEGIERLVSGPGHARYSITVTSCITSGWPTTAPLLPRPRLIASTTSMPSVTLPTTVY